MANLTEEATYEAGIYQIETSDVVLGGPEGLTNVPLKQLANRTAWLKEALGLKAPLSSPEFSGTPKAPTAALGTDTTQIATTAFVKTALASATIADATTTTKGKVELATNTETTAGTDTSRAVTPAGLKAVADTKAPTASPTLTGTPVAPTAASGTSTTQIATTAFVQTAITNATIADATTTTKGKVELATTAEATAGTDESRAVTPAGLKIVADTKAPVASPALTGAPTAPTATAGTNTQQLATTAFVQSAIGSKAWVNFDGSGTIAINASENIASITDNDIGDYTLNFSTAMSDANYAVSGTCSRGDALGDHDNAGIVSLFGPSYISPSYVRIKTAYIYQGVDTDREIDSPLVCVSIIR